MYLPEGPHWLPDYPHEIAIFNNREYDDQVESISQAINWVRGRSRKCYGLLEYAKSISSTATSESPYRHNEALTDMRLHSAFVYGVDPKVIVCTSSAAWMALEEGWTRCYYVGPQAKKEEERHAHFVFK
jgi:hypothetical protein